VRMDVIFGSATTGPVCGVIIHTYTARMANCWLNGARLTSQISASVTRCACRCVDWVLTPAGLLVSRGVAPCFGLLVTIKNNRKGIQRCDPVAVVGRPAIPRVFGMNSDVTAESIQGKRIDCCSIKCCEICVESG
jgi:hypothetical protein